MPIHCKSCGKPIPAADVNIELAIAKCQACDAVFSFLDDIGGHPGRPPRPRVPLPKRFKVDAWGRELTITRSWFTHAVWFLIFFCAFWDGFLVVWYAAGLGMLWQANGMQWGALVMLLFPVIHVAVGVGLTYYLLCAFVNRTVIRVSQGELSVRHGPLPWPGNTRLPTADIQQLFCSESVRRNRRSTTASYEVQALLTSGEKKKLLTGLDDLDHALFIEQTLEQHLEIEDLPVPGEV
ncbi:MAG: hypothetical protein SFU86_25695 [Pirellulaceae bacterium]|nr:hypothetical protein [Pirellulaceae bacterium]